MVEKPYLLDTEKSAGIEFVQGTGQAIKYSGFKFK